MGKLVKVCRRISDLWDQDAQDDAVRALVSLLAFTLVSHRSLITDNHMGLSRLPARRTEHSVLHTPGLEFYSFSR